MKYKVISAVCETENFTKAAEKLNYSQSAVSQAVRNFEKELGVILFERTKKGVKPLEEVKPIIDSIQKIRVEEEKMKRYAKTINDSESGVIKIAYLGDKIEKWFWELFQTFGEEYPEIRCEIRKKTHREVEKDLEKGVLDFAFSFSTDVIGYEFLPYGEDELLVFLPKGHKLADKEAVSVQELEKENILLTSEYAKLEFEKTQNSQFYFSEDSMTLKFVEQGQGICILPKSIANIEESGLEIEVKSFEKKHFQTWGMIYPTDKNLTNVAKKFRDHAFYMYKKNPISVDSAIRVDCKI